MNTYDQPRPQRTVLLWILCIFTFIGSGFGAVSHFICALSPDMVARSVEVMQSMPQFADEQMLKMLHGLAAVKSWQFGLLALAEAAAFTGPMVMLVKLNANGFHIYTLGQILKVCVMTFVIGGVFRTNTAAVMWTVMLVLLFYTQVKYMLPVPEDNAEDNAEDGGGTGREAE